MIRNLHICHWCWEPITYNTNLDEDDVSPLSEFEGETFHTNCLETKLYEDDVAWWKEWELREGSYLPELWWEEYNE